MCRVSTCNKSFCIVLMGEWDWSSQWLKMPSPPLSANTTAMSDPLTLSNNTTLDFFLLFGQRQFSVPIQVILLSLQCYGTPLCSLTCPVSVLPHHASVTCGARKLLSLISSPQNVKTWTGYGGGGRERSSFYHPLSISQKRVGCSILYYHSSCKDTIVALTDLYVCVMFLLQAETGTSIHRGNTLIISIGNSGTFGLHLENTSGLCL